MTDATTGRGAGMKGTAGDEGPEGRTVAPTPHETTDWEDTAGTAPGRDPGTDSVPGAPRGDTVPGAMAASGTGDRTGSAARGETTTGRDVTTDRDGTIGRDAGTDRHGTIGRDAGTSRGGMTGDDATAGRRGTPGIGGHTGGGAAPLLPHEECDKLELRLRQAVAGFVDEPRNAVEEADRVVEEIAGRFAEAVTRRRRTLRMSWQDGERSGKETAHADTEQLRLALRDYRELAERLLQG